LQEREQPPDGAIRHRPDALNRFFVFLLEVLLGFLLCAHAFRSFFRPNPLRITNPNTTEKCVVRTGRFHRNVFGKCTSALLMGVKKNHGSTISAVIIFEPFCKEVPDG